MSARIMGAMQPETKSHATEQVVFDTILCQTLAAIGLDVPADRRERMFAHYCRVLETNRQFNLTRITNATDAAVKHYADSLSILLLASVKRAAPLSVLDVGTGAGFPAVPLAIACPHWRVTAIDSTGKKIRFLAQCAADLQLANLHVEQGRAPEFGHHRPPFDLVLMRAVSPIDKGLADASTLIAPQGHVVFYKTSNISADELDRGNQTAQLLRLARVECLDLQLPTETETLNRRLLVYSRR